MDGTTTLDQTPVTTLRGIGSRVAERFERLGITTVQDLLFHLPLRYEDRTRLVPLGALQPGSEVLIQAQVELSEVRFGKRRMLLSRIADGTGSLTLRFFHFSAAQQQGLARGVTVRCYGEVRRSGPGLEMIHPEYSIISDPDNDLIEPSLTPVYPTTDGLHQLSLRKFCALAIDVMTQQPKRLPELLPKAMRKARHFPDLIQSIQYVHHPSRNADTTMLREGQDPAQRRLAFEELLAHHLSLRQLRRTTEHEYTLQIQDPVGHTRDLHDALPFQLTSAQQRVVDEIFHDLGRQVAMQRLLQGDVGSGKTVIAAIAALAVMRAGYQVALMAPTELLAEQHSRTLLQWLDPLGIRIALLTGKTPAAQRRQLLADMASGSLQCIVGTHALFQADTEFAHLALIIVDEQHRFGVHQRLALREKGRYGDHTPHQLIMTATPIPRTLAMTAYADLDTSVIDELPPGRQPVETAVIPDDRRDEIIERVRVACQSGRQVYWVCTLIDESESLQAQAAEDTAGQLAEILAELSVGLIHGRMKPAEKEQVMDAFRDRKTDILVATTVIEVGVDVPNASLMIIENAERLGLAQLHQLRGRVGRGDTASACVLMYHGNLSENGRTRLAAMRETHDGFEIARRDLELRGPGELLGTRQTGLLQLKIADLARDADLLEDVPAAASDIESNHPELVEPLVRRWVGDRLSYGEV